jgi:acyl phosphate:glycerol-3-phosphate acyltransferase
MTTLAACILAYLIGSVPFAVVVSRVMGLADPREYGSGNPGATNVLRSGNKIAALLTLLGDAAKGWFAVWLAIKLAPQFGLHPTDIALVGFFAFIGHVFTVWLKFKGGKGVATAAGVLLALDWRLGVATLVVWIGVVAASRYSSLGALVAAIFSPIAAWYWLDFSPQWMCVLAMSVVLVWRHAANIQKLIRGEESKIGAKKQAETP